MSRVFTFLKISAIGSLCMMSLDLCENPQKETDKKRETRLTIGWCKVCYNFCWLFKRDAISRNLHNLPRTEFSILKINQKFENLIRNGLCSFGPKVCLVDGKRMGYTCVSSLDISMISTFRIQFMVWRFNYDFLMQIFIVSVKSCRDGDAIVNVK
jgi:hypothetical protein